MTEIVCVRSVWDRTGLPAPRLPGVRLHELHYGPEPGFPFGRRGLALATAWEQLGAKTGAAGMVVLDADVAIDPCDMAAMLTAVRERSQTVHVAPVRLWPASTMRAGWVWGHHQGEASQELVDDPTSWTFSFSYLPRMLLTAAGKAGLRQWTFPAVDTRVAELAAKLEIPAKMVPGCWPRHTHF